jgi:hypothetical protein
MVTGSTASRKAYSMSLLTMTHQGSCCTTPLHIVQQAAALYLFETRQTSCNCFSDPFSSSAPGFISHHPLHGVHPPRGCGARLLVQAGSQVICLSPQPSVERVVGMIAGRRTPEQPSNRLSRAPGFDEDSHLPEPTIRVLSLPYLTRDIADNPIVLQCEEPNLTTPAKKFFPNS